MLEAISRRRSVRKYQDGDIPTEDINEILKAAMSAPSAWGKRPWHFVVVKDGKTKEKLSQATPYAGHCANAPVVLALTADMELAKQWVEDMSIAASHVMLQAAEMGYGTCFVQIRGSEKDGRDAERYVRDVLGIPKGFKVECLIPLGRPAEEKGPHKEEEFDPARVHKEKW